MKTESLAKVISIMEQVNPAEFDMKYLYDKERSTKDVIVHLYKHVYPEATIPTEPNGMLSHENEGILGNFIINYLGAYPWTAEEYNKVLYITSSIWARSKRTNTIQHLIYRIKVLIEGYQPKDIGSEYYRELEIMYG